MDEGHQRETFAFLRETLGLTVEGDLDPTGYTKMAQGALETRLVFTINHDNGWNDLNHWLQPWYGYLHIFLPNTWLDSTDPTFAGRGA